jgi:hypothetical protein
MATFSTPTVYEKELRKSMKEKNEPAEDPNKNYGPLWVFCLYWGKRVRGVSNESRVIEFLELINLCILNLILESCQNGIFGARTWTRTKDHGGISSALYQLSYTRKRN